MTRMNHIGKLNDVLAILTATVSITSVDLKEDVYAVLANTLKVLANDLAPAVEAEAPPLDNEDTSSASKGASKYHDFISELSPHVRRALPNSPQTERFKMMAALWSRHKALGYLEAVVAAKKGLPIYSVPVFGIELEGKVDAGAEQ